MMEWRKVKLGEIAEFKTGKLNSNAAVKGGKYPFFTCAPTPLSINEYAFDQQAILLAGNNAEGNFALNYYNGKFNAYQRTYVITPLNNTDIKYLYYSLSICLKNFKVLSQGTSTRFLTMGILSSFDLSLPPLPTQRRIAAILSSLDAQIENNNRINRNLEAQAQALFKSWFVDFEPWGGVMPEGWKEVSLDEMTSKFGTGLNPRKNFVLGQGTNYYVTIKNMGNNRIYLDDKCDKIDDEAIQKINKRSKLCKGDLLFSGIGTIGRVAFVDETPSNWNTSESVFNMHPKEGFSSNFLYLLLLSDKFQNYVHIHAQGGVQQGIRMASLKAFTMYVPNTEILNTFEEKIAPILQLIRYNHKANDNLASFRDTLLPKLMKGEIEV